MPNAPLTFKILPNLTQIFILRVTNVCIMTALMKGDSHQYCPHAIGGLNCIKSNSSSGQLQADKRVFSFQPFPKLPISWNQVIKRYTSESHRSIYSLENATGNLTLDTGWPSSLQSLPRVGVWLSLPWQTRAQEGLLPFGPFTLHW